LVTHVFRCRDFPYKIVSTTTGIIVIQEETGRSVHDDDECTSDPIIPECDADADADDEDIVLGVM
jgi:hypothetical protein